MVTLYPLSSVQSSSFSSFHSFSSSTTRKCSLSLSLSSWLIHVAMEGDLAEVSDTDINFDAVSASSSSSHETYCCSALCCCDATRRRQLMHATSLHMLMKIRRRTLFRRLCRRGSSQCFAVLTQRTSVDWPWVIGADCFRRRSMKVSI